MTEQETWTFGDADDISVDEEITDWRVALLLDGHERGAVYDTDCAVALARAALICRAVNTHAGLVAALEQAAMDMEAFRLAMGAPDRALFAPCVERIKAALGKVGQ